jgi:hypothetical protein
LELKPAVIVSFTGPREDVLPGQTYRIVWETIDADCGVFLDGFPLAASGSWDLKAPDMPGEVNWTLVARDASCDAATQASAVLAINVVGDAPPSSDASEPTIDAGPTQVVFDTVELPGVKSLDLDNGTIAYTSSNPAGADIQFRNNCEEQEEYNNANAAGNGKPCFELASVPPNAWFDHPQAGVADYDDCLATLPDGIMVLTTPMIGATYIPEHNTGGAVRLCYRTDQGRLGSLIVSLVESGGVCWGDRCWSLWEARISYTTWAGPDE